MLFAPNSTFENFGLSAIFIISFKRFYRRLGWKSFLNLFLLSYDFGSFTAYLLLFGSDEVFSDYLYLPCDSPE